ncbi:MAG: IPT/TIG domain-containing protein [Candidatus Thorarchaeota archaeon]|jgi:hypothetical protein
MTINKITPRGGIPGTTVVVDGSNFGAVEGTITLDGVSVTQITGWTDVSLSFVTPVGTSRDGSYDLVITRDDLSDTSVEQFWIPAVDPFAADIDYQLPSTEAGVFQNDDLPRRAEAAIFNRLLDMVSSGGAGGIGITVASAPEGDTDEVEVSNVTKIRFLTKFIPGEDHYVISRPNGEVVIGGIAPPDTLNGKNLLNPPTLVTGRLSDSNINYEVAGPQAGDQATYITRDDTFTFDTPSPNSVFSFASLGNLILNINGIDVANIDLAANFVELDRSTGQVVANYNTTGTGDTISGGVVTVTGGFLQILSVAPVQGITTDDFQTGEARISLTPASLRQGYNTVTLRHQEGPNTYTAVPLKWFWDQDPAGGGTDPSASSVTLTEDVAVLTPISGVNYYGTGSTFHLDATGIRLFNNVYEQDEEPLLLSGFPGVASQGLSITDPSVSNVSTPPDIGDPMQVDDFGFTVPAGEQGVDARVTITPRDPYGSYTPVLSPSNNYTVMSAGPTSTTTEEFFQDEAYRFPLDTPSFDLVPGAITGLFDSTVALTDVTRATELQVYDHTIGVFKNSLVHPGFDYTAGFQPLGNPDYSSLTPGSLFQYVRVYQATIDRSSGIISVPGIVDTDLITNVKIDVKVPSKTVWLSLNAPFNLSTFTLGGALGTGTDGEGCRIDSGIHSPNINGQLRFTLGPYFTGTTTNRVMYLRITYNSSGIPNILNGSGPGLSLVDW